MMKNIKLVYCTFIVLLLSVTLSFCNYIDAAENSVIEKSTIYQKVYTGITSVNHRLPGSANFEQSAQVLEEALASAGITSYRQSFDTVVPHTRLCTLTVNGLSVQGVYPIGPNNLSLSSTGKDPIHGPLVYLGAGSKKDFNQHRVKGAIVLLDIGSNASGLAYNEGALAIIYVGSNTANQYIINQQLPHTDISLPNAYINRATAEKYDLLTNKSTPAQLQIHSSWEKRHASNIWVHIPANNPTQFNYGNEAIVLAATLDTLGYVPDYCPQKRDAANVALLAQTCVDLAQASLKRDVFIVFFGSHYSLQEGARYFYFVDKKRNQEDYFNKRLASYKDDIKDVNLALEFLSLPYALEHKDHLAYRQGKKAMRSTLENIIDNLNFDIRRVSLKIDAGAKGLTEQNNALRTEKAEWNELLGDLTLNDRPQPEREEKYRVILRDTVAYYQSLHSEISQRIKHNASYKILENHLGDKTIVSHFSFDFSDSKNNWILNYSGDFKGLYNEKSIGLGFFKDHVEQLNILYKKSTTPSQDGAQLINYRHGALRSETLLYPSRRSLSSFAALGAQHFGYNLSSLNSPLAHDQLPFSTDYDLQAMGKQCVEFFTAVSNASSMSVSFSGPKTTYIDLALYEKNGQSNYGVKFKHMVKGGTKIAGPAQNTLTAISSSGGFTSDGLSPIGHIRAGISLSNGEGLVFSPNIMKHSHGGYGVAFDYDQYGIVNRMSLSSHLGQTKGIVQLYYCYGGGYFTPMAPLGYESFTIPKAYKGKNNSKLIARVKISGSDHARIIYSDQEVAVKLVDTQGGLTLLGSTDTEPQGYGFNVDRTSLLSINTINQVASDLSKLNEHRLQNLRSKNIVLDDIETLHANAKDHLQKAEVFRVAGQNGNAQAHELFAATLENHAYQPLVDVSNDMIQAVVILLILSIPFAFSLERLICGFTTIYKQVMGFLGMFLATFTLLYFVHPAFSFASSPTIIFLAFVIILMSGMVIAIIMGKFKREILALQGLAGNAHSSKSDGNTALASVVIGISGMRNRPLKTSLTALTIILLTFTILVFASFGSQIGVNETYLGQNTGVDRIEVHREGYLKLPEHLHDSIHTLYQDRYHILQRGAYFSYPFDLPKGIYRQNAIYVPQTGKSIKITSALGFESREQDINPDVKSVYPKDFNNSLAHPILLHPAISQRLQLSTGDHVTMLGISFTFAGNYNEKALLDLNYLNGNPSTPPDFKETLEKSKELKAASATQIGEILKGMDTSSFRWTMPEDIAIINFDDLATINGFTNAYTLYPQTDSDIYKDSHDIAEIFNGTIISKGPEGVKKFFYSPSFSAAGVGDIIVPLLLGGLIIFSSLLGSIVDREREIFTFSALGLAPPNVAALFFAESSVYAVIGGLGGYIISQLAAVCLVWLSDLGVFQAPDMNFSSLSSTYTILLVMATVLLSTVIPAIKAGKSANPGIARKWKMPTPEGNSISFIFPFTASTTDLGGILTFLAEHFETHGDASLGSFASSEVEVRAQGGGHYTLQSKVSLAPFDLGIFQQFTMSSQDSDIEGIMEINITIQRMSGSPGSWLRSNRKFIDGLRKQFLLWRSLPPETVSHYIQISKGSIAHVS